VEFFANPQEEFPTGRKDDLVKSHQIDGNVKSSRCKARKTYGLWLTYEVRRNDEGEAQRRRWAFYEAIRKE
jgi:hypothetical protein